MAEVLEMEARLKNYISKNIKKITSDIKGMESSAKTSFSGVDKGADKAINTLKKFVGAAAAIAIARKAWMALNQLAKESVELFKVQEQAEQRVITTMEDASAGLFEYASALQKVTTFGDEAIIQAEALISDFIREEKQIKKIIPAVLDFAAAKGVKLAVAADLVTKTVASETNALSRYGIVVEGAAGSTERIESAVNALNKAFGGTATALAEIDTGQLKQVENRIGDIKEGIGEDLIPLYISWAEQQEKILSGIKKIVNAVKLGSNEETQKSKLEMDNEEIALIDKKISSLEKQLKFAELIAKESKGGSLEQKAIDKIKEIEKLIDGLEQKQIDIKINPPSIDKEKEKPTDADIKAAEEAAKKQAEITKKALEERRKFIADDIKQTQALIDAQVKAMEKAEKSKSDIHMQNLLKKQEADRQAAASQIEAEKVLRDIKAQLLPEGLAKEAAILKNADDDMIERLIANEQTITDIKAAADDDTIERLIATGQTITDIKAAAAMKRGELLGGMAELKKQEEIQSAVDKYQQIAAAASQLSNNIIGLSRQTRQNDLANEKERIGAMKITQKEKEKLIKRAEDANRKAAIKEKAIALNMAVVNTALGVTSALTVKPTALGIVLAALIGAAGAVEIATIASQKMAGGGIVGGSPVGDKNIIAANANEVVLNPRQQAELLFNIANGGGRGGDGGSFNIAFNVAAGANLDNDAADRIVNSVEGLGLALENANRAGTLNDFKEQIFSERQLS